MGEYTAVYDACVLYPAPLRDLLMHLAATGLFRARWTEQIHDEWIRNLVKKGLDPQRLLRTKALMNQAVPDCLVSGYEHLIESLELPDKDDRHVLAAAIAGGADVIVTSNLAHFPEAALEMHGIEAEHPDDFIVSQLELAPDAAYGAIRTQRRSLSNPPYSVDEFIRIMARQQLPRTVQKLREFADLI